MSDVQNDISEIAQSIWETLFLLPLEKAEPHSRLPDDVALITGCVQIDGAWKGAVMLQCPESLAERLASELFRSDSATSPEEVQDTVGELTNMLAGNIKALLPQPSRISLPTVALGADYALRVIGTQLVAEVTFRCADAPIVVTLMQGAAVAEA